MNKKPLKFMSDKNKTIWNFEDDDEIDLDLSIDWNDYDDLSNVNVSNLTPDVGLVLSLKNKGCVDLEYISNLIQMSKDDIIVALQGNIFQNPNKWNENLYEGYETSEEYLSGNLKRKWLAAKKASEEYPGRFIDNITALEEIMPPALASEDIYISLGSPWLPADIIDDFIIYLFGTNYKTNYIPEQLKTKHDLITGTWDIPEKSRYGDSIQVTKSFGTSKLNALQIIEKTLNMASLEVYDIQKEIKNDKIKNKKIPNQGETLLANDKQKKLITEFKDWIWTDETRKQRLINIYDATYSANHIRKFNGSFLTFPGMVKDISLWRYQKNAVARILFSPNTLLAHEVGTGKTFIMIAAGMELKRMGLSTKNMYLIPNDLLAQWEINFKFLYPDANIFCVGPENFAKNKRFEVLKKIKNEDFDAILIAYSSFKLIPMSLKSYKDSLLRELTRINQALEDGAVSSTSLRRKQKDLSKKVVELTTKLETETFPEEIFFDELGITHLFVDEAHNFKNVTFETRTKSVSGLSKGEAYSCQDLMEKVRFIQSENNGGGITFATGTPITNSLTDIFVIQKYLQNGELTMLELHNFDSWLGMFAEQSTEFEVDIDTSKYKFTKRFSKFHNLPELTNILASVADFHKMDKRDDVPILDKTFNEEISRTQVFIDYLNDISTRADAVRNHKVDRKIDNLLKITIDGRKAALDLRLVNIIDLPNAESKVLRCAQNVAKIYADTKKNKATQLVFCDLSTPKKGFNIYDDLKDKLISLGVSPSEIAFIHDATDDEKRALLAEMVNNGDIRVVIGSTSKLGQGTNVQNRLLAVHHLDVPWRPSDMIQREGRILRQGNMHEKVYIYRYVTTGSFDAYSWQLLEMKQRFISSILAGNISDRSGSDVDDTVLTYAQIKALALGDSALKDRFETENELSRLLILQSKYKEERYSLEEKLNLIPKQQAELKDKIEMIKRDFYTYNNKITKLNPDNVATFKQDCQNNIYERLKNNVHDDSFIFGDMAITRDYFGLALVLPIDGNLKKPYIIIHGQNKYPVELGSSPEDYIKKIDDRIASLKQDIELLENEITALSQKAQDIENALQTGADYSNDIEIARAKLENIDRMLGVKKDGNE